MRAHLFTSAKLGVFLLLLLQGAYLFASINEILTLVPQVLGDVSVSAEAPPQLSLLGRHWWPPEVFIRRAARTIDGGSTQFSIIANKEIAIQKLPAGWTFVYVQQNAGQYFYLLASPQLVPGEHALELKFADKWDNQVSRRIVVTVGATDMEIPAWDNSRYYIDGDNLFAIANKSIRLPEDYEPEDLMLLSDLGIPVANNAKLRREAALALQKMTQAIAASKIDYKVTSGYRSFYDQVTTYKFWVNYNAGNVAAADTVSARPGHSEHQLGTTIDFTTNANGNVFHKFEVTPLSKWLAEHAHEYGFALSYPQDKSHITGYTYEPWHYRYIGIENAGKLRESGLTLTEWLLQRNYDLGLLDKVE